MGRYGRVSMVIIGWVILFALIELVLWPIAVLFLGSYTWTTLPLDVFLSTFVVLVAVLFPILWTVSMGVMALFTATMEVLDREH